MVVCIGWDYVYQKFKRTEHVGRGENSSVVDLLVFCNLKGLQTLCIVYRNGQNVRGLQASVVFVVNFLGPYGFLIDKLGHVFIFAENLSSSDVSTGSLHACSLGGKEWFGVRCNVGSWSTKEGIDVFEVELQKIDFHGTQLIKEPRAFWRCQRWSFCAAQTWLLDEAKTITQHTWRFFGSWLLEHPAGCQMVALKK